MADSIYLHGNLANLDFGHLCRNLSNTAGVQLVGSGSGQFAGILLYYARFLPVWLESDTNGQIPKKVAGIWPTQNSMKMVRISSLLPDSGLHHQNPVKVDRILLASDEISSSVIFRRW